jgi:4-hydroxy-tetrahydrodipicolinate reductase
MKIALIGYGKMGKAIEQIASSKNHDIVLKIQSDNLEDFNTENLRDVDVAIEFSTPENAIPNIKKLILNNIPVVCGTTGWHNELDQVSYYVKQHKGSLIYASNFSIGVNLFFLLNEYAAKLMKDFQQYSISIHEIHHTAKLDAPSGTAISVADGILKNNPNYISWTKGVSDNPNSLSIISDRKDPYPGKHDVSYVSNIDKIMLSHEAFSREGFAGGALLAAEWILDKKGIFTMKDLFSF